MKTALLLLTLSAAYAQPTVTATAKGPNQINLTWAAASGSFYGYLVEVQSSGDSRYASYVELAPIATASGYTCDPALPWGGGSNVSFTGCNISDAIGAYVYNPAVNGAPYWVTESQYIDPQDGTAAQFIAWGLKNNTAYNFRVRTYSGNTNPTYGSYSSVASATTSNYTLRYASTTGSNSNDGTAPDDAHAWLTVSYGAGHISCGQELIVLAGTYANDNFNLQTSCTAGSKGVIIASAGDSVNITSNSTIFFGGAHNVLDSINIVTSNIGQSYSLWVSGDHNAMLNVNLGPAAANIPSSWGGISIRTGGTYALIYRCYIHDIGSPYATQNPSGNGGFPIQGGSNGVFWSNHMTRGSHDSSFYESGASSNRILNGVFDGGWGMAWETQFDDAHFNLFEGNIGYYAGVLEATIYKPAFELSSGYNTVRRNIFYNYSGTPARGIEISAYGTSGTGQQQSNLVYSNVLYGGATCYFQSSNQFVADPTTYNGVLVQNNICYGFSTQATEIYNNDPTTASIGYNSFLKSGGTGSEAVAVWYQSGGGSSPGGSCLGRYDTAQTVTYADSCYLPAWSHNAALSVNPLFVDAANLDFHLKTGSPLIGAGTYVTDASWTFPVSAGIAVNLGPFQSSVTVPATYLSGKSSLSGGVIVH